MDKRKKYDYVFKVKTAIFEGIFATDTEEEKQGVRTTISFHERNHYPTEFWSAVDETYSFRPIRTRLFGMSLCKRTICILLLP
jgi:hypothetical protein